MAKLALSLILILSCTMFATMPGGASAARKSWFANIGQENEKVTELRFYVHNKPRGPDATGYVVARSTITANSATLFGQVLVIDDLLTAAPDINSEEVGRFQGIVTSSDLETFAPALNVNAYFTSGKYRGSTLSIVGRNQINDQERELAVVGGTGAFRFARGYATTSTYSNNAATDYSVFEYTLYVTHVDESAKYI